MKLSEALKAIIANPDDLSQLPSLVEKVAELEKSEEGYQSRIANLQEVNRKYLNLIPIEGKEPEKAPEPIDYRAEAKAFLNDLLGPKGE